MTFFRHRRLRDRSRPSGVRLEIARHRRPARRRGGEGRSSGRSRPSRASCRRESGPGRWHDRLALGGLSRRPGDRETPGERQGRRQGHEPLWRYTALSGLRQRQRVDDRASPRSGRRPECQASRRRDGLDDRLTHRKTRGREGIARTRCRGQHQGAARADGPHVGSGGGACGGRRDPPQSRGRFPDRPTLGIHAPVVCGARRSHGRRANPVEGRGRHQRGDAGSKIVGTISEPRYHAADPRRRERSLRVSRHAVRGRCQPERPEIGLHGTPHADLGSQAEPRRRRERRSRPHRLRKHEQSSVRREARGARGRRQCTAQEGARGEVSSTEPAQPLSCWPRRRPTSRS